MSAKHFLTDPTHAVVAALKSQTLTNPSLAFDEANRVLYRHPASVQDSSSKVSIISGGGSGHEPGWVGYVGKGFLTACVAGTIFASPSAAQVRACIAHRLPKDSTGILVLVMNYTGDVLNFGMGAEKARAMGKKVEMVILGDDAGVGREKGGKVGRRGIAGATFAIKVCGALAEMGGSLEDVAHVGRVAGSNVVSVAASLSRVHVIGRPVSDAEAEAERLPHGTVEIGMGIHNEPGCEQLETDDLPQLVRKMLAQLLDETDADRAYLHIDRSSDRVVMLINNFGGLSNLELGAITTEVWTQLTHSYGLTPLRLYSGVFNGSLNGLGFGVSLLRLADTGLVGPGRSLLELVDAPCEVVGWPAPIDVSTWGHLWPALEERDSEEEDRPQPSTLQVDPALYTRMLRSGLERVVAAEADITRYDSLVGDGDCGTGLRRGADAILSLLSPSSSSTLSTTSPAHVTSDLLVNLGAVIHAIETHMDGTSGALYAIFTNALAANLRALASPPHLQEQEQQEQQPTPVTPALWAAALQRSLDGLAHYTPAKPGDRTLVDALEPFVRVLGSESESGSVKAAAAAATRGAQSTVGMRASLGRSVYVGGEDWRSVPDPGAFGLAAFLEGVADGC